MSCISAKVNIIGSDIQASVFAISNGITATCRKITESLRPNISFDGCKLKANLTALGERLYANCSIVCTIAEIADYLEVSPTEVQWITDDIGVFFDVKSNVQWIVTTE